MQAYVEHANITVSNIDDAVQFIQFAAKHEMQQLFLISRFAHGSAPIFSVVPGAPAPALSFGPSYSLPLWRDQAFPYVRSPDRQLMRHGAHPDNCKRACPR